MGIQGEEEAPVLPHDFPGHQGATFRESQLSDDFVKSKVGSTPTYNGNGTSTDVIVASARAYLDAMNRMIDSQDKKQRPSWAGGDGRLLYHKAQLESTRRGGI